MSSRTLRPGGRAARVQAAVHQATRELLDAHGRAGLTVPMIAAQAGVTPSTIYRRWGDLGELLADVSTECMRPDGEPADTGSVAGDLAAWGEQYREEMSTEVGRAMLRDVLQSCGNWGPGVGRSPCMSFTADQIGIIVARGVARGERVPSVDAVLDTLVAPIIYRLLMDAVPPTPQQVARWVQACMQGATKQARAA